MAPPLYVGTQEVSKLYLGSQELGSAYLGATQVFGAGEAPMPGAKNDTYPDLENYIYGLKTRPTIPAYTGANEINFTSMSDLRTKLVTALGATAAAEGRVTHLHQTGHLTNSAFNWADIDVKTGAKVVIFGNGYNIDCNNGLAHWTFANKSGNSLGWLDKAEIAEVYYPNTGDPMSFDDVVVRFATALPEGCAVGKCMKIWTPVLTIDAAFQDPVGLAAVYTRYANRQRQGAHKKVKSINGLEVLLHGPLYDAPANYFDQCAKSGSYSLYGSILDATPEAIIFNGLHIDGFIHSTNFVHQNLDGTTFLDCLLEQREAQDTPTDYERVFAFEGSWQSKLVDTVFRQENNLPLSKRYGVSDRYSSGRTSWVRTGQNPSSPNEVFGYEGNATRHIWDCSGADWWLNTGQSDDYYAMRAGMVVEMCCVDTIFDGGDAPDMGFHSNGCGHVIDAVQCKNRVNGHNNYNRFGGRSYRTLFRDIVHFATECPTTPGDDIIRIPSTGAGWPIKAAGAWYQEFLRCTFDINEASHQFMEVGGSVTGPQRMRQNVIKYRQSMEGNRLYDFTHGLGVNGNSAATINTVPPGPIDALMMDKIELHTETNLTLARMRNDITVRCDAEVDFTGRSTIQITGFDGSASVGGGVKAYGKLYYANRSGPPAPILKIGTVDTTGLVVVNGPRPTTVPSIAASFTATRISDTQIDLAWTASAEGRESFYQIEWSADGNVPWMPLYTAAPNEFSFSHTGLTPVTTYYYRLRPANYLGGAAWLQRSRSTEAPAGPNNPPVAVADSASVNEDQTVTINVLANDSDLDGDPLTLTALDTVGTTGTVTIVGSQAVYDPNGQFDSLEGGQSATDTFSYTVSDGEDTDTASVTVTVQGVSAPSWSTAAQAVIDRLNGVGTGLTAGEETAVGNFVEGCETDGNWTKIGEVNCFVLSDSTVALTGWIGHTASLAGTASLVSTGVQTPDGSANYVNLGYNLDSANLAVSLTNTNIGFHAVVEDAIHDGNNSALFGIYDGQTQGFFELRWRNDQDFNGWCNRNATGLFAIFGSAQNNDAVDGTGGDGAVMWSIGSFGSGPTARVQKNGVNQPQPTPKSETLQDKPNGVNLIMGGRMDSGGPNGSVGNSDFIFSMGIICLGDAGAFDSAALWNRIKTLRTALSIT